MQKLRSARVAVYRSRRGISNEPRNVAIYLLRTLRGDNLEEIGRDFNISRFSSVSSVVERMRRKVFRNRQLIKWVEEINCDTHESSVDLPFFLMALPFLLYHFFGMAKPTYLNRTRCCIEVFFRDLQPPSEWPLST